MAVETARLEQETAKRVLRATRRVEAMPVGTQSDDRPSRLEKFKGFDAVIVGGDRGSMIMAVPTETGGTTTIKVEDFGRFSASDVGETLRFDVSGDTYAIAGYTAGNAAATPVVYDELDLTGDATGESRFATFTVHTNDYTDERYWVKAAEVTTTGSDETDIVAWDVRNDRRRLHVTATNVAETNAVEKHSLCIGTPVYVRIVHVAPVGAATANNTTKRYQFTLLAASLFCAVGGDFTAAGTIRANTALAKWNGCSLTSPGGTDDAVTGTWTVEDYVVWNNAGTLEHYVCGGLELSSTSEPILKWNGTSWDAIAGDAGMTEVNAMAVYNGDLYIAGIGSGSNTHLRKTSNGSTWSDVGSFNDASVTLRALHVHDGSLYIGGDFNLCETATFNSVARWNGSAYSALDLGVLLNLGPAQGSVWSFATHDDGSGEELYVGGEFNYAGDGADQITTKNVAAWTGSAWRDLNGGKAGGASEAIEALASYDSGSGSKLYAGGNMGGPFVWDGANWHDLPGGLTSIAGTFQIFAMELFEDDLLIGGEFDERAANEPDEQAKRVAKYDTTASDWIALDNGLNNDCHGLAVGVDSRLYAVGAFTQASGVSASRVAAWDDNAKSWAAVGLGVNGLAWAAVMDTANDELFVGGEFTTAGGQPANRIARWTGTSWHPLRGGVTGGNVLGLYYIAGNLHVVGTFTSANGTTTTGWATWVPSSAAWSVERNPQISSGAGPWRVNAAVRYNDNGDTLTFVGGYFDDIEAGTTAYNMARLDDTGRATVWDNAHGGVNGEVHALCVYDSGGGDELYVCGEFTKADPGGVNLTVANIAMWDGTAWNALPTSGDPDPPLRAMWVYDSGGGDELYVAGKDEVRKYNGTTWSQVGTDFEGEVHAITSGDAGGGTALFCGGAYRGASGATTSEGPALGIVRYNANGYGDFLGGIGKRVTAGGGDGTVKAIHVNAGAVYYGGLFKMANRIYAERIARITHRGARPYARGFRGTSLGGATGIVYDLMQFGGYTWATGNFATAVNLPGASGGELVTASGIARIGISGEWEQPGSGLSDEGRAFVVHGGQLHVCTFGPGSPSVGVVKMWTEATASWSARGSFSSSNLLALASYPEPGESTDTLWVAGEALDGTQHTMARLNEAAEPEAWVKDSPYLGFPTRINCMIVYKGELYAGGVTWWPISVVYKRTDTGSGPKWDWVQGTGFPSAGEVQAMAVTLDANGNDDLLICVGENLTGGNNYCSYNGTSWSDEGTLGAGDTLKAARSQRLKTGEGPDDEVFYGGEVETMDSVDMLNIGRWSGTHTKAPVGVNGFVWGFDREDSRSDV